jgi:hypothetical protein
MVSASMSKTLVYSCVAGNHDDVTKSLLSSLAPMEQDVSYVLYTDQIIKDAVKISQDCLQYQAPSGSIVWQIKPLVWEHPLCKRRTARFCKVNDHILCTDDITHTIWLDGTQVIKENVKLVNSMVPLLKDNFISTFKHPERVCIYQELNACIRWKKDNKTLMQQQIANYRKQGYPTYNGLVETACVIRKRGEIAAEFNKNWWAEIEHNSYRDQLSFNYVAWKYKQKYGLIPGHRVKSNFFHHRLHLK